MSLWAGEHQASSLERLVKARHRSPSGPAAAGPSRVLLAAGGRGGVGTTTLAVNLAVALQQWGRRVLVVDADARAGGVGMLCGLEFSHNLGDFLAGRIDLGHVLEPGPGDILCAAGAGGYPGVEASGLDRLLRVLQDRGREPHYLIVDLPAGPGPAAQFRPVPAAHILLVTTPEPAALTGAYAVVKATSRANPAARFHLVVNQARGGEADQAFRRLQSAALRFLNVHVSYVGSVPVDPAVRRAVEAQVPFVLGRPTAPASGAVQSLARRLDLRWAAAADRTSGVSAIPASVRGRGKAP